VFDGLRILLNPQNSPERQAKALIRLKRYAGLEKGYPPLVDLARRQEAIELKRPGLLGPYDEELKQNLGNTDAYLKGLKEMFIAAKLEGWQGPMATLEKQLHDYNSWMMTNVLPRARHEAKKPAVIYADSLKQVGVNIGPDELIERATADFLEVQGQLQQLAKHMAHERNLPSSDYRDILRDLKKISYRQIKC